MWFPHLETVNPTSQPGFPAFETWGEPIVDPSFHAMEACKPEQRMVFPLERPHEKIVSRWKTHRNLL